MRAEYRGKKRELIQHHEQCIRRHQTSTQRFAQNEDAALVPDHWTAEEVDENLAAANIIHKEQEQAGDKVNNARVTFEEVHGSLHYQFLELTRSTENLGRRLRQILQIPASFVQAQESSPCTRRLHTIIRRNRGTMVRQAMSQDLTGLNTIHLPEGQPADRAPQSKDIQRTP